MTRRALRLTSDEDRVPPLEVSEERVLLGRAPEAGARLDHPSISRRHAELTRTSTGWVLTELGSTRGTFLNSVRVDEGERAALQDGDRLRVGEVRLMVTVAGPPFERPPIAPREAEAQPSLSRDEFLTRGSLLLRLGDDDTLVRELSWSDFHAQYAPILRGFARKAGCPSDRLDDIVQEVVVGFFRASERFEYDPDKGRFRGYLKTATIRALQAQRRRGRGLEQWDPERFLDQPEEVDDAWDTEWMRQLLERAVRHVTATTNLAASSWDAFELYGRRGLSLTDAAAQLEMQPEAVKKAKNRVAALVRAEVDRLRAEEG